MRQGWRFGVALCRWLSWKASEPHRESRAAARSTSTRLLITPVNRSRRELNYRAGIIPSGFGCQQQPRRGRAAPWDRRSSTEPAASAAFARATCRACGQRDPGWGSVMSCRASACKSESPKQGRLQALLAKKLSIGTGPLTLVLYVSTPVIISSF